MLKLLSAISALSWAGLATWVTAATPGNADKVFLYCVGVIALTGIASAIGILIFPRTFFIIYCFTLSIIFAVPSVPSTILTFSLCIGNLPVTSAIDWLRPLNFAVLVCLPVAWAFQVRRHLNEVANECLTSRCS
jgi:hypothetical protein